MSQYLNVQVSNGYLMRNTRIEPASTSGSTGYSITGATSQSSTLGVGFNSDDELSINGSNTYTLETSASVSYTKNALKVITNEDDNGYATWKYDYVSSGANSEQNAYLFGSSVQYGSFSWNLDKDLNSVYTVRELKFTAIFGGGNTSTNKRYTGWSDTNNYHLGSISKTITIRY